jgi:hypothetical protein
VESSFGGGKRQIVKYWTNIHRQGGESEKKKERDRDMHKKNREQILKLPSKVQ